MTYGPRFEQLTPLAPRRSFSSQALTPVVDTEHDFLIALLFRSTALFVALRAPGLESSPG